MPLYYNQNQKENKLFYHKSCYKGNNNYNLEKLDKDKKEIDKYELYKKCKEGIIANLNKDEKFKKKAIEQFFKDCEKNFEPINKYDNYKFWKSDPPKKIDKEIISKEIKKLKINLKIG